MLQNGIVLSIFKIWNRNIRFVWNLIEDIHLNFYDDDFITVTSLVLRTQSVSAIFCPAVFFYNSPSVKLHCHLRQQWPTSTITFKRQPLTFHFSMYRPKLFKDLSHQSHAGQIAWENRLLRSLHRLSKQFKQHND